MADLGIAHLSLRQADFKGRRLQVRHRLRFDKAVPDRRPAKGNGIVVGLVAVAPAIEDAQDDRAGTIGGIRLSHGHNIGFIGGVAIAHNRVRGDDPRELSKKQAISIS